MRIDDPAAVARQYATAHDLEARRSLYANAEGPENGADIIGRHFERIERRDADGWVTIDNDDVVRAFVASLDAEPATVLPPYELPIRSRRASSVFVATKT